MMFNKRTLRGSFKLKDIAKEFKIDILYISDEIEL
jgi:hypothetical protein